MFFMLRAGFVFFCKQKTAYEMRISDWSSGWCSSDLAAGPVCPGGARKAQRGLPAIPRRGALGILRPSLHAGSGDRLSERPEVILYGRWARGGNIKPQSSIV